ncbi:MAG: hypothetical protein QM396_08465 [Euryarchaeota archaeon]|uniref:hypothetical protein n=1 Tax=Methanobacterium sp. MZD130B TaxID=3394378 RepID=UPI0017688AD7|nr:hypothetical protein [Euryarchaeota archaeon]HHT18480.1 hypothetical protein [Methanobacterium sp.]
MNPPSTSSKAKTSPKIGVGCVPHIIGKIGYFTQCGKVVFIKCGSIFQSYDVTGLGIIYRSCILTSF